MLTEYDWFNGPPKPLVRAQERLDAAISKLTKRTRQTQDPTTLILIDEADRLKMSGLEQARDVYDRSDLGLVLIGMPGLEKQLARYPQLYSRVGFVHQFRPLSEAETRRVLQHQWKADGSLSLESRVPNEEVVAAIIRVTGGNFRLIQRLLTQIARVMEINSATQVTVPVVEAARESLVIGTA